MAERNDTQPRAGISSKPPEGGSPVFALDIGTRSVVGLVGAQRADGFHVFDYEQIEHPARAMTDGQVEDINAVALTISKVKENLESRLGFSLQGAAVAAAGRALRTVRTRLTREVSEGGVIDAPFVLGMESEAIEQAQSSIQDNDAPSSLRFYFVGYSVMRYSMDGLPVSSLIGHSCSSASVELIAAFLPFSVIESLYASVENCGLTVSSLTLEPIAAMNVLIPPELRLLNLALVDIGAGTSDIALCRDGSVCAYEMATVAGDELTEAVIKHCLVPFETAEELKRRLSGGEDTLEYEDVLGMSQQIKRQELLSVLEPSIDMLASVISDKILECNGEVPSAVFVIGGGSLIPGLGEKLSRHLKLDASKISAGRNRPLRGVVSDFPQLNSPEFVTPIGIGVTAVKQQSFQFWGVTVNGKPLKLLITHEMRMIDLLLMAGFQSSQILGRTGRNLLFYLDGEQQLIKGGMPEHASLLCNGGMASVDTLVYPGDHIEFSPAQNGQDASLRLGDLISQNERGCVKLCSRRCRIGIWAEINGKYAPSDTQIQPQDRIVTRRADTLGELYESIFPGLELPVFLCDGVPLSADSALYDGMRITLRPGEAPLDFPADFREAKAGSVVDTAAVAPAVKAPDAADSIMTGQTDVKPMEISPEAHVESTPAETPDAKCDIAADKARYDFGAQDEDIYGEDDEENSAVEPALFPEDIPALAHVSPESKVSPVLRLTLNGKQLTLPLDEEHPRYYMMNLLGLCGLDLKNPKGNISMLLNGAPAAFSKVIDDGDIAQIGWKQNG